MNVFDFIIAIGALIRILIKYVSKIEIDTSFLLALRFFRIARIFKFFRRFRSLDVVF